MTNHAESAPGAVFEVRDRVRWADSDPFGIIYYGAYIRLFGVAEQEMMRACGLPYERLRIEKGVWLPRKALQVEFHSPAQLDEEVIIQSWIARIGTTSLTMRFEVLRASDRTRRGSATLTVVSVEKATMQKRPLPDDVRASLSAYLHAT